MPYWLSGIHLLTHYTITGLTREPRDIFLWRNSSWLLRNYMLKQLLEPLGNWVQLQWLQTLPSFTWCWVCCLQIWGKEQRWGICHGGKNHGGFKGIPKERQDSEHQVHNPCQPLLARCWGKLWRWGWSNNGHSIKSEMQGTRSSKQWP